MSNSTTLFMLLSNALTNRRDLAPFLNTCYTFMDHSILCILYMHLFFIISNLHLQVDWNFLIAIIKEIDWNHLLLILITVPLQVWPYAYSLITSLSINAILISALIYLSWGYILLYIQPKISSFVKSITEVGEILIIIRKLSVTSHSFEHYCIILWWCKTYMLPIYLVLFLTILITTINKICSINQYTSVYVCTILFLFFFLIILIDIYEHLILVNGLPYTQNIHGVWGYSGNFYGGPPGPPPGNPFYLPSPPNNNPERKNAIYREDNSIVSIMRNQIECRGNGSWSLYTRYYPPHATLTEVQRLHMNETFKWCNIPSEYSVKLSYVQESHGNQERIGRQGSRSLWIPVVPSERFIALYVSASENRYIKEFWLD